MRIASVPKSEDRCRAAIKYGNNLFTRCMFKKGHASERGKHEGKGLKRYEYQRIVWLGGDGREFFTDRDLEWAWSERRDRGDGQGAAGQG